MESSITSLGSQRRDLSFADWVNLCPIITKLYQDQGFTMNQVRLHLEKAGFRVTTRMVRARITQWNLHRNHQLRDMTAALRLLDLDPHLWSSPEPRFLVRGRLVTMKEIVHFFRRKGIRDPLSWAHASTVVRNDTHITLLNDETDSTGEKSHWHEQPVQLAIAEAPVMWPYSLTKHLLTLDEKAVATLQDYCSAYIKQEYMGHEEPQVHQYTIHGRFGERMRDGLAHMIRNSAEAFPNFRRGFDLIRDLLSDCHPMALGQFLAVVCSLASHQAHAILSSLLRYASLMASTLGVNSSVTKFLIAMRSSPDVLGTAVLCLRAAVIVFAEQRSVSWQKFYMQERLCGCLYYGNAHAEGSTYRTGLLLEQEALYGSVARNVLFTLTNVASDHVHAGDIESAQAKYTLALRQTESLADPGRAKVRFAALRGLAQCETILFEKMRQGPPGIVEELPSLHLQNASRYIREALYQAQRSFAQTNRRTVRALEYQVQIENLLGAMGQQPM
ncbi:hypothetical protein DE146DRAFT_653128 [Phaeosphaeria sp. MPI-PUGE-AT-0046c]|nr:hypothetical protein DE146DRAFT_653128 [Phaeosphaeria sp. MPI-PUGE-AT-0046c]